MDTLWLYWEGPMPPYIRLCIDLLKKHNPNARLIGPKDLPDLGFSRRVIDAINTWHVAQRSDAIRAILLGPHGGMWSDVDCIPFKPFTYLLKAAQTSPVGFASYRNAEGAIGANLVAGRPDSPIVRGWVDCVMRFVNQGKVPGWLAVSSRPLRHLATQVGYERIPLIGIQQAQGIHWSMQRRLLERGPDEAHASVLRKRPNAICMMLSNQVLQNPRRDLPVRITELTEHQLLESDMLISYLFRESEKRLSATARPSKHRALMTLNLYNDGLMPNFRESHMAAARRWGAEYVEVRTGIVSWKAPYWEKLNLDKHAADFEHVVYVDRDVIIREDCPNLFELQPIDTMAAVPSEQPGHELLHTIKPVMQPLCDRIGVNLDFSTDYFNSGVLVFSPVHHAHVFEAARFIHALDERGGWVLSDQGRLSLAIKWTGEKINVLSSQYNRCGNRLWRRWTPHMDCYVWHFCGRKFPEAMVLTQWKVVRTSHEPRVIATRNDMLDLIPKGAIVAEIGVFRGDFSQIILNRCNPKELHLIDLWHGRVGSADKDGKNFVVEPDTEAVFLRLAERWKHDKRVYLHRGDSLIVLQTFPDAYFDAAYLDSSHRYHQTLAELEQLARVVKPGGWIMGHDLNDKCGVWNALHVWCARTGRKIEYITADGIPSFAVRN
ncbi:MAG: hypothetical protein Kow0040_14680 [Thermogutta sp.]